jgi:CheY-like chemotaxis protein
MSGGANKLAVIDRQPSSNLAQLSPATAQAAAARITALRILHVDDEPDIREVVELSLSLDPAFTVRSCASGSDALAMAAEWLPDLILCDVMMPVMDGPAMLARLRESPQTARIPLVFMTARAQTRELEHFKSLGATGVIAKPFDPMTLASAIHGHLRTAGLAYLRSGFTKRLRADAAVLAGCRADLANPAARSTALEQIRKFAHALAGAAGIFGFQEITQVARRLEQTIDSKGEANGTLETVEGALNTLLTCIDCVPVPETPPAVPRAQE